MALLLDTNSKERQFVRVTAHDYCGRIPELDIEMRQDLVDNAIFELLIDTADLHDWNIEIIGEVRDAVAEILERKGVMTADEYYPEAETSSFEQVREQIAKLDSFGGFIEMAFISLWQLPLAEKLAVLFVLLFLFLGLPIFFG